MLNSESIVIFRIKGNIYYIAKYPGDDRIWMGECLLKSPPRGNIYYIAKYPGGRFTIEQIFLGGNLLYSKHSGGRFAIRKVDYTTQE